MRYFFLLLFFLGGCNNPEDSLPSEQFPYTNTKFLKKRKSVRKHLCKYNEFCPVSFTSEDVIMLKGLFRQNPNAQATIIGFAGFYPGKKEGLALFAQLFDEAKYNVLLVDARGHGQSAGQWLNLRYFGRDEYRDVIAALEYVHEQTDKPIIIYGLCAGGFHAAKALIHLKPAYIKQLQVRGLVFDSGWASVCEIKSHAVHQEIKRRIPTRFLQWIISALVDIGYYLFFQLSFQETDKKFNLRNMIERIDIPVFYIHSETDQYSPVKWCEELSQKTKNKQCWILPEGRHAHLHLQYPEQLGKNVNHFLKRVLQREISADFKNV